MKILLLGRPSEARLAELRSSFPTVEFVSAATPAEQISLAADADAIYGWPSREVVLAARRLRWVQVGGVGIERIHESPELVESPAVLTNARGASADTIADHVFALILALARRIPEIEGDRQARRWDRPLRSSQMRELSGSTLGIVGFGRIGLAVAQRAAAFGQEILAVDVNPVPPGPHLTEVWGPERLDDLLRLSDYVVVTVPLTPQTRGMLDGRRLGLMKTGAYLVVVSRGGIVDEAALVEALRAGPLAGAALDTTVQEPLPADSPLWEVDNLIITPHCAGYSVQSTERSWAIFKENVRRFGAGEPLLNVCDKRAGY
ncbi:MAG: D-2-hydroxyacid dehydrogenase [Chloroflexi bacterium]|nr:D-2-hydroxyacid dehydrogenase [Chloroflexota bacterium]